MPEHDPSRGACEPSPAPEQAAAAPSATPAGAVDDGTFLQRIDPLGGQWQVASIGGEDFQSFKAWVNFSAGGFPNHGAGFRGYSLGWKLENRVLRQWRDSPDLARQMQPRISESQPGRGGPSSIFVAVGRLFCGYKLPTLRNRNRNIGVLDCVFQRCQPKPSSSLCARSIAGN